MSHAPLPASATSAAAPSRRHKMTDFIAWCSACTLLPLITELLFSVTDGTAGYYYLSAFALVVGYIALTLAAIITGIIRKTLLASLVGVLISYPSRW